MTPLEQGIWWGVLILSLVGVALSAGTEIGCYSLNRVRLDLRAARTGIEGNSARILRGELAHPARLLGTLLIAVNVITAISAEASARLLAAGKFSEVEIMLINTLALGPLIFVFSEALPKELFRVEADRLTPMMAYPLRVSRLLLTVLGVLPLVQGAAVLLERMLGLQQDKESDARSRIALLIKEGAGGGALSESQVSLVDRAMAFGAVRVGEEMTPWSRVRVLPAGVERGRAMELAKNVEHAYLPCVDKSGRVVGVLQHLDLYAHAKKSVQELTREVPRLSPDMSARDALGKLRTTRSRMAIVEDGAGRPLGIVTARDLIEPLTGELAGL